MKNSKSSEMRFCPSVLPEIKMTNLRLAFTRRNRSSNYHFYTSYCVTAHRKWQRHRIFSQYYIGYWSKKKIPGKIGLDVSDIILFARDNPNCRQISTYKKHMYIGTPIKLYGCISKKVGSNNKNHRSVHKIKNRRY